MPFLTAKTDNSCTPNSEAKSSSEVIESKLLEWLVACCSSLAARTDSATLVGDLGDFDAVLLELVLDLWVSGDDSVAAAADDV